MTSDPGGSPVRAADLDPEVVQALRHVGVGLAAQRLYLELLRTCGTLPETAAGRDVETLVAAGLVRRVEGPGQVQVNDPAPVLRRWALRREDEAARAQAAASELGGLFERHLGSAHEYVDFLSGAQAIRREVATMQEQTVGIFRGLDRGPYLPDMNPEPTHEQLRNLAAGIRYQVVYATDVLAYDGLRSMVYRCMEAGEEARVAPSVPMKLLISDDRVGLIGLSRGGGADAVIVRRSPLLEAMTELFDTIWSTAVPLNPRSEPRGVGAEQEVFDPEQRAQLVRGLAAGLTDEAMARELGVSTRTVSRRIAALQQQLGCRSRFQLGVQVARQGWL